VSSTPAKSTYKLPPAIWWLCVACVAVTLFAWCFSSIQYRHTHQDDYSLWPHDASIPFTDFSQYQPLFAQFHQEAFFEADDSFAYPAPSAVIYNILFHLGPHQRQIYCGAILFSAFLVAFLFLRALMRANVDPAHATLFSACALLTSWPALFLFERANLEFVVWLIAALGMWALLRDRPMLAAVLFGVAGSTKLYPFVLLALLFNPKQMRAFFVGVATFGLSLIASWWYVGPTIPIAFHGTINGILGFVGDYAATAHTELVFDHSFLATIKQFAANPPFNLTDFTHYTHIYVPVVLTAAALLFLLRVRHLPLINRTLFVMICMVGLPPVSYDYTLVHLYIPFGLFLLAYIRADQARAGLPDSDLPGFKRALCCFGLIFTPELFLTHHTFGLNGVLKSASLIYLLARHPIHDIELPDERVALTESEPVYA